MPLTLLRLVRPINVLIAFLSTLTGAFSAYGTVTDGAVLIAGGAIACGCAAANVSNDWFDREIDQVNKPYRPLPSGAVSLRVAAWLSISLYVAALTLATLVGWSHAALAGVMAVLSLLYNGWLKRQGLLGNVMVSLTAAAVFLFGGLCGAKPLFALIPAVFAFLFHLGREIVKDMEDVAGDRVGGMASLPIRYGVSAARNTAKAVFLVLIALTFLPVHQGWFGTPYLAVVIFVDMMVLYALYTLSQDSGAENAGRVGRLLKADMALGLVALLTGRL